MTKQRKLFTYSKENKAVMADDQVVFYVEDIHPDVIAQVYDMWNKGKELKEIQHWLDKGTELCTLEESEYITEQIENWEKLSDPVATSYGTYISAIDPIQVPGEEAEKTPIGEGRVIVHPDVLAGKTLQIAEEPVKKTRQKRSITTPATGTKVLATSVIEKLKEQAEKTIKLIEMVEWIERTEVPADMPPDMSKGVREALLQYAKEIEAVKGRFIQVVQEL